MEINFSVDELESEKPSIFLSAPRQSLIPRELCCETNGLPYWLRLHLTSELGSGATGLVHSGTLTVTSDDSSRPIYTTTVAAKFAFFESTQAWLEDEYSTLSSLAAKGVKGVPVPIGLFHDLDSEGQMVMIMSFLGMPLGRIKGQLLTDTQW